MLTPLIDLLSTASAIGLVSSLAAIGIVVLPWGSSESEHTSDALDAAVRFPADALRLRAAPVAATAPAVARVVAR